MGVTAPIPAPAPAAAPRPPASPIAAKLRDVMAGLRHDLNVSRHVMRGEVTYILRDPVSFDTHAFDVTDYRVLVALDGERTLGEAFEVLCARGACDVQHEENYYRFVLDLHRSGLLSLPISDEKQLQMRNDRKRVANRRKLLMAPLFLKIPVWNPDSHLARTVHLFAPLFTRTALVVWCLFAALCAALVAHRWGELAGQLPALLAPEQLLSMWVLLAVLKVIHEFGHGYAVRAFGGAVPEMGVSLIVFTPCAYVDASASWAFSSRIRRIVVCLGGMYFESWIAGLALFVWAFTDSGMMHAVAYQTMVLASITTIGFNMNPLLRYDGYFILSDLLQVPNLRQVAQDHAMRVLRRCTLGIDEGGKSWGPVLGPTLVGYALGAAIFRITIVLGMCAVIALKFPVVGFVAGVVYGAGVLIGTLVKSLRYLWFAKATAGVRTRAVALSALMLGVPAILIGTPLPRSVYAAGVVERERMVLVNAVEPGRIEALEYGPGESVSEGDPIARLVSVEAEEELAKAEAELHAVTIELEQAESRDPLEASKVRESKQAAVVRRDAALRRVANLTIRAPMDGTVAKVDRPDEIGQSLATGDTVVAIEAGARIATLVVDQHSFARLRTAERKDVELRSRSRPNEVLHGTIDSIAPAGSSVLASAALSVPGGGSIPVSPVTGATESSHFEIRVRLADADAESFPRGARVEARLPAESESYARRWYGALIWFNEQLSAAR